MNVHIDQMTIIKFPSSRLDDLEESLDNVAKQIEKLDMKVSELFPALTQLGDKLEQAKAELVALLDQLRQSDPDVSPEGAQAIARINAIVDALDALTPNESTPPVEQPPAEEPPSEGFRGGKHKK